MSNPNDKPNRLRWRARAMQTLSAVVVVCATTGLLAVSALSAAPPVAAATVTASALTVKWAGDTSSAQTSQPVRDPASPHYPEFKNIAITVDQTSGIIDQAVRVHVTGFAGTKSSPDFGTNSQNFLQAMECWGVDPLAADFNETCEWGGKYAPNNGLGNSVPYDNVLRVAPVDLDTTNPTGFDVPFRAYDAKKPNGVSYSGKPVVLADKTTTYPILDLFGPATTNEVTSARVGSDGTGFFDFETQSADSAPQLGCGTQGHLKCWLVVVPRGTVFGGNGAQCSGVQDPAVDYVPYSYGRPNSIQGGSPVNPHCDYWKNRINIPLTFAPTGSSCVVGSTEQRVVGSQLMVNAMSSWQPALCQSLKATYAFSTNTDSLARAQLLENTANVAFTGFPVNSGELLTESDRTLLTKTDFAYAPVAVSSVVVAFTAEFDSGKQENLVLSPRLLAKILTQSYQFTVPWNDSDPPANFAHLGAANRKYSYLNQDPDFRALNPSNYSKFTSNPVIILPGPSGADGIRQVWRWILADKDAVDFLNGIPDPISGMTVNPYYLPKGDPNATVPWHLDANKNYIEQAVTRAVGLANIDGSPFKLSESSIDNFPKNDEGLVPLQLQKDQKFRFDTIQFAPYTDTMLTGARQAFRADGGAKTVWNPTKINQAGEVGDWVSSGPQPPGQKFAITITDGPSALRYGLSEASLTVPNSAKAVQPDVAGMTAAMPALSATTVDAVKQIDPAKVPSSGYPLTVVTYAAVNLTKTQSAARQSIADMIKQVTTSGQVAGTEVGQLPAGYLPLTGDLASQAASAADKVRNYTPQGTTRSSTTGTPAFTGIGQDGLDTPAKSLDTLAKATDPKQSAAPKASTELTETTQVQPIALSALAVALGVGLLGLLVGPVLFRGRGFF